MHPNLSEALMKKERLNRSDNQLFRDTMKEKALKAFVSALVDPDPGCTSGWSATIQPILTGTGIGQDAPLRIHSEQIQNCLHYARNVNRGSFMSQPWAWFKFSYIGAWHLPRASANSSSLPKASALGNLQFKIPVNARERQNYLHKFGRPDWTLIWSLAELYTTTCL